MTMVRFMGWWVTGQSELQIDLASKDVYYLNKLAEDDRHSITKATVLISANDDLELSSLEEVRSDLGAIGKLLPNLKSTLVKSKVEGTCVALPLEVLRELLNQTKDSLQELKSFGIQWKMGAHRKDFVRSVVEATKLRRVDFEWRLQPIRAGMGSLLFEAFKSNQALDNVFVRRKSSKPESFRFGRHRSEGRSEGLLDVELSGVLPPTTLVQELCNKPSCLRVLKLNGVSYHQTEIGRTLQGLNAQSISLRELQVLRWDGLTTVYPFELGHAIRLLEPFANAGAASLLETLRVDVSMANPTEALRLIEILSTIQSLRNLTLRVDNRQGLSPLPFLTVLAQSKSIERLQMTADFFCIFPNPMFLKRNQIYDAIRKYHGYRDGESVLDEIKTFDVAMSKNTSLKELSIEGLADEEDLSEVLSENAKFWLKVNAAGRDRLFESRDDTNLWVNVIKKHKRDPRITFYLLSMNPSLCNFLGDKPEWKRAAAKKRKLTH